MKETWQTKEESIFLGLGAKDEETGTKSLREVEEFVIHPNVIKTLGQGHVLRISRLVDIVSQIVQVSRAPEYQPTQFGDERSLLFSAPRPTIRVPEKEAIIIKKPVAKIQDNEVFV